jgi:hypothetical protein
VLHEISVAVALFNVLNPETFKLDRTELLAEKFENDAVLELVKALDKETVPPHEKLPETLKFPAEVRFDI